MEEQNHGEVSVAASSSIHMPFLQATEEGEGADQPQVTETESRVSSYLPLLPNENGPSAFIRDDYLFCIMVVLAFWLFVSVSLILGFYGDSTLRLGPNCSILIKPNPFFVNYIKVEQLHNKSVQGQMLYGFHEVPPLDVVTQWSVSHNAYLLANHRKDLIHFLNEGSQINISYSVKSSSLSSLILAIAEGNNNGFAKWIQDMSYPSTTLSWNIIHGNGMIQQNFKKSSTYYIGIINWNSEAVEVNLNLEIKNILHNTSEAYFTCTLAQGKCSFKTFFPNGNAAVLTTPGPKEGTSYDDWSIKLSYAPRWSTYIVGIGGMCLLMLVAFHFFTKCGPCICDNTSRVQARETGPTTRVPLLLQKDDDDGSSWGSSYDSGSEGGDDHEDGPLIDGEFDINMRRLCVICFDSPRESFFLPCGHCAACFACGTRIAAASKTCPICRRRIKKVKKIYTV